MRQVPKNFVFFALAGEFALVLTLVLTLAATAGVAHAQAPFQRADLTTDRGLRDRQLSRCAREVQKSSRDFKTPQCLKRDAPQNVGCMRLTRGANECKSLGDLRVA